MNDLVRTAITGTTLVSLTGFLAAPIIALSLGNPSLPDPLMRFWCRQILRAAGVRVVARGLENVPRDRQFVMVLNHQSHFDVLVVFGQVERHMRFVAKRELFSIPVFGQVIHATGNLPVDRSGGGKDRATMVQAVEAVKERVSVIFFGEGTRSDDGKLGPFKKGAAVLAIQAGVPLIPVAVGGTADILPKGRNLIQGGRVASLCIGEPLETTGLTFDDREALTDRARSAVAALLDQANALIA